MPPDLLARLAEEGDSDQRAAALNTMASSASIRARRLIVGSLLRDPGTRDAALAFFMPAAAVEHRSVYDARHAGQTGLPGTKERGEGDPPVADVAVNEAYDGAGTTFDFYEQVFGRNSIDDQGMELISSVHYGSGYDNALWNGTQMIYGDGSGRIFREGSLTTAIDVIAHELTHGITQATAGLEYHDQPGALNESVSDVVGSIVKQHSLGQTADQADWLIGAGLFVPGIGQALRSMKAPGTAFQGDPQIAHMDNFRHLPADNNPRNDNGGVHINSGIPNRAFYLTATAIGGNAWEKPGKIWYTALTQHLKPTSEFGDAAEATVQVAGELYGPTEQDATRAAWHEVGVL